MVPAAVSFQRTKTTSIIVLAIATLVAAIWLAPRGPRTAVGNPPTTRFATPPPGTDPCAMTLTSRLTSTFVMAGERDDHLVVSMRAANCGDNQVRPPMSLAIVLDRSSSMAPENVQTDKQPLTHAKQAVMALVDKLEPTDAFSIVTYSSGAEILTPMLLATPDAKLAARRAVAAVEGVGETNISAGLELGDAQVGHSPVRDGIRRLVLVSDGNANQGEFTQDGLSRVAAQIAETTSITAVGLGLQYSESKMRAIAAAGRGNYYFVEDPTELASIFAAELGSVGTIVATDAELELIPSDNLDIVEVFTYGARQDGSSWIIPVADLAAGDTRKIVARVRVRAGTAGTIDLATAHLSYRPVDAHQHRELTSVAKAEVTADVATVRAGIDTATIKLVEDAETARAIDEASKVYASQGYAAAGELLDRRMQAARANAQAMGVAGAADSALEAAASVKRQFAAPPSSGAAAIKAAGKQSYDLMK